MSDRRYIPDVMLHGALIDEVYRRLRAARACRQWNDEELKYHTWSQAHVLLTKWYDAERATVSTMLMKYLGKQVLNLYQREILDGRGRMCRFADVQRGERRLDDQCMECAEELESEIVQESMGRFREFLQACTEREQEMVWAKMRGLTLAQVGEQCGLTRERVRQVLNEVADRFDASLRVRRGRQNAHRGPIKRVRPQASFVET